MAATMAAGGALSHHHGVGLNRARYMPEHLGPAFDVLVAVKAALDPGGILNPGKLGLAVSLRRGRLAVASRRTGWPGGRADRSSAVANPAARQRGAGPTSYGAARRDPTTHWRITRPTQTAPPSTKRNPGPAKPPHPGRRPGA